jgi:enoyl-CoA hydratase/carnithine racemase
MADSAAVLRIDDRGRVRLLTLDRPDQLNAFNDALYDALRDAFTDAGHDDDVAVVVLTGAGKAFTAGQDLAELTDPPRYERDGDDPADHGFRPMITVAATFPKPLIAAVNGLGVGIGCTILAHCDIVLVADTARLRAPFVSLGVVPEAASSRLFPERMGWQAAAELLYTAQWLDADAAVDTGLARRKVAHERLLVEALELADRIAAMPITSLVETKKLLLEARGDLSPLLDREFDQFLSMVGGPANAEAIAAFREKRDPDFSTL